MYFFDPSFHQLPINDQYGQPTPQLHYAQLVPLPQPPNAKSYPRLTVRQNDWCQSGQCFMGQCKVVAKIEGSSLPDYQCRAIYTLTFVQLGGWIEQSAPCSFGPVVVGSGVLMVSWDANGGDCPVVEATTSMENHWTINRVAASGPCELFVASAKGTDLPSYSCPAFYTLKCDPLEGWTEFYDTDVPTIAKNGADSAVVDSKNADHGPASDGSHNVCPTGGENGCSTSLHNRSFDLNNMFTEQWRKSFAPTEPTSLSQNGTFAATCETSRKTGRQNDLKSSFANAFPKTEDNSLKQYEVPINSVSQANNDNQKQSASVEKSSIGLTGNAPTPLTDSSMRGVTQEHTTTGARVVNQPSVLSIIKDTVRKNADTHVLNHVEGRVQNGNAFAAFPSSLSRLVKPNDPKTQHKFDIPNVNLKADPITESSHENSKTYTLENKVSLPSSPERSADAVSVPIDELARLLKLLDRFEFYEKEYILTKQRMDSVVRDLKSCINSAIQKPEISDSTFYTYYPSSHMEGLKPSAADVDAQPVDNPRSFNIFPAKLDSKSQDVSSIREEELTLVDLCVDSSTSQPLVRAGGSFDAEDKQQDAQTDSSQKEKDGESQVTGNQRSSVQIPSDKESSKDESSECDSEDDDDSEDFSEWETVN